MELDTHHLTSSQRGLWQPSTLKICLCHNPPACQYLLANPALKILSANIKTLGEIEKKPKLRGSVWHAKAT